MKHSLKINSNTYGYLNPYIIAEIGVNHEGDLERAKKMIHEASVAGANAVKFQFYKADLIASKYDSPAYWDTSKEKCRSQYQLFRKFDTFGQKEYKILLKYSDQEGVDFLCTPFDLKAAEIIAPMCPVMKIASADLTNIPLLRACASYGKPIILSTGGSSLKEIYNSVQVLTKAGCKELILLHCVLNYPTSPENAQLSSIEDLAMKFKNQVSGFGYSDHVAPEKDGSCPSLEMAALMGAVVLEKHFTDDRSATGNDHYHAFDLGGLRDFREKLDGFRVLYGGKKKNLKHESQAIENARRRIFAKKELKAGAVIKESDLIPLRANKGIGVVSWDHVIGLSLKKNISQGSPIFEDDLNGYPPENDI